MDGAKLAIDVAKLVSDLAAGKGSLVLVGDVAAALYDQIGAAKLEAIGVEFIAHVREREVKNLGFPKDGPG